MPDFDDDTWLLLVNPISGGGRGVRDRSKIEAALAAHGQRHLAVQSEYPGHAIALVSEAIDQGCRRVLVAGGDGSVSEAVNGIFEQRSAAPEAVLLALLPIGTGNDWARGPGPTPDYDGALRLIAAEATSEKDRQRRHDVGVIEFPATGKARYFINVAGGGFDAAVIERMPSRRFGRLAYLLGLLRALAAYRPLSLHLSIDGRKEAAEAFVFFACIGRYCGGGMLVAPRARSDDGLLDLTLIRHMSRWRVLASLPRLFDGSLERHPKVSVWRAGSAAIEAPAGTAIEADGELVGHAPATLTVLRRALRIVAPPAWAAQALQ
ncbi:MAG TPA: diacylglycerol kinase family protein [Rhodocyclaceae bacterium]|nr:diacylglycerol kinase family protein [Rhodocyclaceae bacterium]